MRYPYQLIHRDAETLNIVVGVAPEHDDTCGSLIKHLLDHAQHPRRAAILMNPAKIDQYLRPEIGHFDKKASAPQVCHQESCDAGSGMNRTAHYAIRLRRLARSHDCRKARI